MVFRRKGGSTAEVSSRAKEIGQELTESVDHLKQAAIVAREAFGPTVGTARDAIAHRAEAGRDAVRPTWESMIATLAPLVAEAQESGRKAATMSRRQLRKATKEAKRQSAKATSRRRWPWVVGGALVIGGAAGVAGALMRKRASRSEWEEYGSGSSRSTTDTLKAKAGQAQERISETAHSLKEKVTSSGQSGDSTRSQSEQSGDAARRSVESASGARPSPSVGGSGNYSRPS